MKGADQRQGLGDCDVLEEEQSPNICINPFHGDALGEHYSGYSDPIDGWSVYVRNVGGNMAVDRDFPTREAAWVYIEVLKNRYDLTDDDVREF